MKECLFRLALIFASLAFVMSGCVEAATPANEIPLYGNLAKSAEQLAADQRFIAEMSKAAGGREAASSAFVQKGWQFISQRDANNAIKRFNQAWLLNPNSAEVFWGFGAALGLRNDFDRSIEMFEKAQLMSPGNARMLTDYGRTYVLKAAEERTSAKRTADLDRAIPIFEKAIAISPNEANTYAQYAIAFFYKDDFARAWEMVHKATRIDQRAVDLEFRNDLRAKMPEPPQK